jgi:hypothetical protein
MYMNPIVAVVLAAILFLGATIVRRDMAGTK